MDASPSQRNLPNEYTHFELVMFGPFQMHFSLNIGEQAEPIHTHILIICIHNHLVKKGVNRRLQAGQSQHRLIKGGSRDKRGIWQGVHRAQQGLEARGASGAPRDARGDAGPDAASIQWRLWAGLT